MSEYLQINVMLKRFHSCNHHNAIKVFSRSKFQLRQIYNYFFAQIRRQKRRSTAAIDTQIENYDYDNTNDKDNFCPAGDEVCRDYYLVTILVKQKTQVSIFLKIKHSMDRTGQERTYFHIC